MFYLDADIKQATFDDNLSLETSQNATILKCANIIEWNIVETFDDKSSRYNKMKAVKCGSEVL